MITIGLPVMNGEKYLEQSIQSLLNQDYDYDDIEIILSDNASTDRTQEICLSFFDNRIKYFRHDNHLERGKAFQFLLQKTTGEYFMLASDDDLWESNCVSHLKDVFNTHPDCVLAYPRVLTIDENDVIIRSYKELLRLSNITNTVNRLKIILLSQERLGKANILMGLIKTDILKKVSLHKDNEWGSDYLIIFEIAINGPIIYNQDAILYKRQTQNNLRRWVGRNKKELIAKYLQCYVGIIEDSSLDDSEKLSLLQTLKEKSVA